MLFIFTSYTANIVALLQSTTESINTLQDMLDAGLEFASHDTTYARQWFPRMSESDAPRKAIFEKMLSKEPFIEHRDGVENIRRVSSDFLM